MRKLLSRIRRRENLNCCAVVVAAGSARRMEGIDKILAPLGGVPVLVHTLMTFEQCPDIAETIVVTREDLLVEVSRLCKEYSLNKVSKILVGGDERILSVRAGLREVDKRTELIAIHDGARPFLSQKTLNEVLARAKTCGAAAPAIEISDTIKRVHDGIVQETVDRDCLRAVQTPQVFQADLIRAAIEQAVRDCAQITDDCCAVERIGMQVSLTAGDRRNIKITTPFDLALGEIILEEKEES